MKNKTILYLGVASLIAAGSLAYTDSHANNAQYIYRHVHGKAEALKHEKVSIDLNIPKDIYRSENMPSIVARVTNFIESVTWGVSGELPNGVSINPSGVFSGTPTEDGTFRFSLTAKGPGNVFLDEGTYSLTVHQPISTKDDNYEVLRLNENYSFPLAISGGVAPYTAKIVSGSLPAGMSLSNLALSGTPTSIETKSVAIRITDANGRSAVSNWLLEVQDKLTIVSGNFPDAYVTLPYDFTFKGEGGAGNYTWVANGELPNGLSFKSNNQGITGTPQNSGQFSIGITLHDTPQRVSATEMLHVYDMPSIANMTYPDAYIGETYRADGPALTGGKGRLAWSADLPFGLNIDSTNGAISGNVGTGTVDTPSTFAIRVTDSNGVSGTGNYSITLRNPVVIANSILPDIVTGHKFSQTLSANGGKLPYQWSLSGNVPDGLTIASSTGTLSGTIVATSGEYEFTAHLRDANGRQAQRQLRQKVESLPLAVSQLNLPAYFYIGDKTPINIKLTASGGSNTYSWSAVGLPNGVSIDQNGLINGTPTVAGNFNVTVTLKDTILGTTTTTNSSMSVFNGLAVAGNFPGTYETTNSVNVQLQPSGGKSPYSYALVSGSLPTGVSLNASTGLVSGTVSSVGTFSPTFRVTDANGRTAQRSASFTTSRRVVTANVAAGGSTLTLSSVSPVSGVWTNPLVDKVINIPSGVVRGSSNVNAAAVRIGNAWAGSLRLNVVGQIQGAGGAANGGRGGNALEVNTTGLNGERITITGHGNILAGGGGGGRGGNGGTGGGGSHQSEVRDPPTGDKGTNSTWHTSAVRDYRRIIWEGVQVGSSFSNNSGPHTIGNYTYHRGGKKRTEQYGVSRTYVETSNTNGGAGGAGGNGGVGQGYGQSVANGNGGAGGANGGTNAGRGGNGGAGGRGGGWGASGSAGAVGATGANGNRTNGAAGTGGQAGGQPGTKIVNQQNAVLQ